MGSEMCIRDRAEVEAAIDFARRSPLPDRSELARGLYASTGGDPS